MAPGSEESAMTPVQPVRWWRPDSLARRRQRLEARAALTRATRDWFLTRGFLEVETPALQPSPGMEPHLQAFETLLRDERHGRPEPRYLHTSPELAMKKLLAAGLPRIFQMARVFRNGERSALHHPEFTMLEWYRAGALYRDLIEDCRGLLETASAVVGDPGALRRGDLQADPRADWTVLTVAEAFSRYAGIDLLATTPDPSSPDLGRLDAQARAIGHQARAGDRWEDLYFRIFLDRIEPRLGVGAPTVLMDYPASMAALARLKPEDPRVAERLELYVCGVELANGFGELVDPAVQRSRFEADMALKQVLYGERYPIDEDFLAALSFVPPSAGMALGLDRLAMLVTGAERIEEVLWAPVDPPAGLG